MRTKLAKDSQSYADLAAAYQRDKDYRIVQVPRPASSTAVLAPHGGGIDASTLARWLGESEGWPEDAARDLAGEYERARDLLARFAASA